MATSPVLTELEPTTATDVDLDEQADEAKTADDAPAPVHPDAERDVLVRDAHGNDPYGRERDELELGKAPYDLPDPRVADLRGAKAAEPSNKD